MKILIAEDDMVIREIIKSQLENWGYEVTCVDNGDAALEVLQGPHAPKMAILDWQMPGLSGPEVCRKVRAQKTGSYVYLLMLTSLDEKLHVIQGLESGADDYLSKPCNPHELKVRLVAGKRILELESELLAALRQLKEMVMVRRENNIYETSLTGRELDILRLMAKGRNDEEIARTYHMSPDWVSAYLINIIQKLGVDTRKEACEKAIEDGLLVEKVLI